MSEKLFDILSKFVCSEKEEEIRKAHSFLTLKTLSFILLIFRCSFHIQLT